MKELRVIQSKLVAPKNQHNSFGNYNYRSAEDILAAAKPLLDETECTLTITDDVVAIGNRIYVKATVTLTNASGEAVTTSAFAREDESKKGMDGSQVTGASSSYARKYALNGLFAIDDVKDADATNTHGKEPQAQQKQQTTKISREAIIASVAEAKTVAEITKIWNAYPALKNDTNFKNAVAQRGAELKTK